MMKSNLTMIIEAYKRWFHENAIKGAVEMPLQLVTPESLIGIETIFENDQLQISRSYHVLNLFPAQTKDHIFSQFRFSETSFGIKLPNGDINEMVPYDYALLT